MWTCYSDGTAALTRFYDQTVGRYTCSHAAITCAHASPGALWAGDAAGRVVCLHDEPALMVRVVNPSSASHTRTEITSIWACPSRPSVVIASDAAAWLTLIDSGAFCEADAVDCCRFGTATAIASVPWSSTRADAAAPATASKLAPQLCPWQQKGYGAAAAACDGFAAPSWRLLIGHSSGVLVLWDVTGMRLRPMSVIGEPAAPVRELAVLGELSMLVSGHGDGLLRVWPLPCPAMQLLSLPHGRPAHWSIRHGAVRTQHGRLVSMDRLGTRLVTAGAAGDVDVRDALELRAQAMHQLHASVMQPAALSPQGMGASSLGSPPLSPNSLNSALLQEYLRRAAATCIGASESGKAGVAGGLVTRMATAEQQGEQGPVLMAHALVSDNQLQGWQGPRSGVAAGLCASIGSTWGVGSAGLCHGASDLGLVSTAGNLYSVPEEDSAGGCFVGGRSGGASSPAAAAVRASALMALKAHLLDPSDVYLGELLGDGGINGAGVRIWRGTWRHTPVAVQGLPAPSGCAQRLADLAHRLVGDRDAGKALSPGSWELVRALLALAGAFQHTSMVGLVGMCLQPPLLVTEYQAGSSLRNLMDKARSSDPDALSRLQWMDRLSMLHDIAAGLAFLHDRSYVHGNLRSSSILITEDGHARISGLGFGQLSGASYCAYTATEEQEAWLASSSCCSTPRAAAPNRSEDVFRFGTILEELLTCTCSGDPSKTVGFANGSFNSLKQLAAECCALNPDDRPPASYIVERLQSVIDCEQAVLQMRANVAALLAPRASVRGTPGSALLEAGGNGSASGEALETRRTFDMLIADASGVHRLTGLPVMLRRLSRITRRATCGSSAFGGGAGGGGGDGGGAGGGICGGAGLCRLSTAEPLSGSDSAAGARTPEHQLERLANAGLAEAAAEVLQTVMGPSRRTTAMQTDTGQVILLLEDATDSRDASAGGAEEDDARDPRDDPYTTGTAAAAVPEVQPSDLLIPFGLAAVEESRRLAAAAVQGNPARTPFAPQDGGADDPSREGPAADQQRPGASPPSFASTNPAARRILGVSTPRRSNSSGSGVVVALASLQGGGASFKGAGASIGKGNLSLKAMSSLAAAVKTFPVEVVSALLSWAPSPGQPRRTCSGHGVSEGGECSSAVRSPSVSLGVSSAVIAAGMGPNT
ncbi:hypothetical protein GPECTOR_15g529 [Gonium pectorale]|uniref:Protein kinase domain-containing protein n=1 Tax=Gonium pectorale TaxID=33097 RepID=A0A150GLX3_GONPE|nr:hypothetical protein GPECTOR_15g529 [Gonium pectorale]|eukprot:KXZ50843.1 hypothetical protein GPECTOR_15g529 [Gonium pectorale]